MYILLSGSALWKAIQTATSGCTSVCVCLKEEKERLSLARSATVSRVMADQAPRHWWLIQSAVQAGGWCTSSTSAVLAHSQGPITSVAWWWSMVCLCSCLDFAAAGDNHASPEYFRELRKIVKEVCIGQPPLC